jgi:hypothetical protein
MLEFEFEGTKWDLDGPEEFPEARLMTTLKINGVFHHCEAIAVVEQRDEYEDDEDAPMIQVAAHDNFSSMLEDIDVYDGGDGPFSTTKVGELPHDYIIVVTPFRT